MNLDLDQCVGALDDKATEGVAQWVLHCLVDHALDRVDGGLSETWIAAFASEVVDC